jgi:hypothetical protein
MLNAFELPMLVAGLVAVSFLRHRQPCLLRSLQRQWTQLANRRGLAVVLMGLFGLVSGAAVTVCVGWPVPRIHDEFSYLLAADTFARGRLTNPPHPLWLFFESFHINQLPTYCSIYPPGQGLFLALGQILGGAPIVGVWISYGLACAAVTWMLQGWLPPRWALLGGFLAAVRVGFLGSWAGMQGYWSQSFWGGAVAMLGGALVFGSLPRLLGRPRVSQAVLLGLGLAILANSRPFEGALAAAPVGVALVWWLVRSQAHSWRIRFLRVVLPLGCVLVLTGAAMAYYNYRLTGHPLLMPYQHNGNTYAFIPLFLWQPLQPEPSYHHDQIRAYHEDWARTQYLAKRTPTGYFKDLTQRLNAFCGFYLGLTLLIPLVAFRWIVRGRGMRLAALSCAVVFGGLSVTTWFQPHYAAPLTAPLFPLVVGGLRRFRLWKWDGRPLGRVFVQAVPVVYAGLLLFAVGIRAQGEEGAWYTERARLQERLEHDGKRHLILVHYGAGYPPLQEWVYNGADIDGARVLWARGLGAEANQPLVAYFRDRSLWLLEVEETTLRLQPYP